jgi:hypothetical protein
VHEVLRSPGQPLDAATRAFMEPRFGLNFAAVQTRAQTSVPAPACLSVGQPNDQFEQEADSVAKRIARMPVDPAHGRYDFAGVRIHTDDQAAQAARAMNAHAFTVGPHIVVDPSQYAPHTAAGRDLLAHELTHVVQQTAGSQASSSVVAQRLPSPRIQGRWRLDRVTPEAGPEIAFTNENGSVRSWALGSGQVGLVSGNATAWQEQGWVRTEVGGEAQVSRRLTTHYIFRNDGLDNDFLQLRVSGDITGTAKAEDRLHAKAYGVTWGRITERTAANRTPQNQELFPPETAGGVSAATLRNLGEVELEIPVGEGGGSARLNFHLTTVDEGDFAGFAEPLAATRDVSDSIDEVDLFIGSHIYAEADIESSYALFASLDENYARAIATFALQWESRPSPTPRAGAGGDVEPPDEIGILAKRRCWSGRNCEGKAYRQKFAHCHNCWNYASGKSLGEPGACENC